MPGKECYHCRQWIEDPKTHDCWTTTEEKLTEDLSEDLREAWERLRETAIGFGEQRIYASHKSIMFSRKTCYFFVRPKRAVLEVCFFLPRTVKAAAVRKAQPVSKTKVSHLVQVKHRDEVEEPFTLWLKEAYEAGGHPPAKPAKNSSKKLRKKQSKKKTVRISLAKRRGQVKKSR